MTFGETLSRLMDKAGVKRVQLAEHLGYDVSYISRWAGGQKLPSVKNNGDLIKQIAAYISKSAGEDEKSAVCAAFGLESRLSGAEFEKWVASVLTAAYGEQLAKSQLRAQQAKPCGNALFTAEANSYEENNRMIAAAVAEFGRRYPNATLEVFSLPKLEDFGYNECKTYWDNILAGLPETVKVHIRLVVDADAQRPSFNVCRDICVFYSGIPERVAVDIFSGDAKGDPDYSLWLCRDVIVCLSFRDPLADRSSVILTQDAGALSEYYGAAEAYLRGKQTLFSQSNFQRLYAEKYFQSFVIGRSFSSLNTVMPVFLAGEEQLSRLCAAGSMTEPIMSMYEYYEKILNDSTFIIYKSVFVQFFFDGKLHSFDDSAVLGGGERREFLKNLADGIRSETRHLKVLSDINPLLCRSDINSSVYISSGSMFVIRHSGQNPIYRSEDKGLTANFAAYFKAIETLPAPYVMTDAEAAAFLESGMEMV